MNFNLRAFYGSVIPQRIRGMFNLNDPRWGRGDDKPNSDAHDNGASGNTPGSNAPQQPSQNNGQNNNQRPGPASGPPDLDELWRDLNRKLSQFLGGKNGGPPHKGPPNGSGSNGLPPIFRNLGIGVILGAFLLIWLGTGFQNIVAV